jgi:hypothetical protein
MRRLAMTALVLLLAMATFAGGAEAKKRHRYLPVRCDSAFRAVIDKTGLQLQAQYNGMGFGIASPQDVDSSGSLADGTLTGEACRYIGTRHLKGGVSTGVREGVGFMNDYLSEGEPPFPGETNSAIREYDWTWRETVSHTKKGALVGTISGPVKCTKASYEGSQSDPHYIQEYPC